MTSDPPSARESEVDSDERNWAVLSHVAALLASVFVLGQVLVPLGIWLWKKDTSAFVEANARESLNFQLSMTIYFVVAAVLTYVLVGFPMIAALAVVELVCVVLAAVHASRGESYRYPFSLRLVT